MALRNTLARSWATTSRAPSRLPCFCACGPSTSFAAATSGSINLKAGWKRHQSSSSKRPAEPIKDAQRPSKVLSSSTAARSKPSRPRLLRLAGQDQRLGRVSAVTYAEELAVPSLIEALTQEGLVSTGQSKDAREWRGCLEAP